MNMKKDIDCIIDMLSWNNSTEIQKKVYYLLKKLNAFMLLFNRERHGGKMFGIIARLHFRREVMMFWRRFYKNYLNGYKI